jgi:Protein of unknown function (DUF3306)
MDDKPDAPQPFSLKRWSQRKREATRMAPAETMPPSAAPAELNPAAVLPPAAPATTAETVALPPVESLHFESDFSAFMQPKVDEETRRAALKKLFSDPSFNVMDGLDIYTGDYTQPDPMPPGMLDKLSAVYAMLDPPKPPEDAQVVAADDAVVAGLAHSVEPAAPTAVEPNPEREPEPAADRAATSHKSA